jgi:uncharacterized protein YyaL (SSP411 family)
MQAVLAPILMASIALAGFACTGSPAGEPEPVASVDAPAAAPTTDPAPIPQPSTPVMASTPAPDPPAVELRNRLGDETSPYLLQHRSNPVHWFAWGPEAFAAARALNRPIFLSVGYSTCYWCHVMERESFESEAVAEILNEHFICIKVDREERPDVDEIYMKAVQLTNQGQGGWPMSVFIEPDGLRPFLGGTYFPPEDRGGRPGFPSVLRQIATLWETRRDDVLRQSRMIADAIAEQLSVTDAPRPLDRTDVERAVSQLLSSYDRQDGGFVGSPQRAPKFPVAPTLDLLIGAAWELEPVRRAVTYTLDRMAIGGMYDQVGGGFHRYSTDAIWLVPHFEKMLYDNGQLASTYAEVYRRTGDELYARILRETLDYVRREMTSPDGGFFSAQDAEVNHREGQNYLWQPEQVRTALESAGHGDLVDFALRLYGLDRGTNFQDPHHPEDPPANVLFLADRPGPLAESLGLAPEELDQRRRTVNAALLAVRDGRDQPLTDDKILSGWNGLMIAGMADGAEVLDEPAFRAAAVEAAEFVLTRMRGPDGGLLRTWRGGTAKIDAFLEDYAFMVRGLLALHGATGEPRWRSAAAELTALARSRFWDESGGGFYDTLADRADLFVRTRSTYDGAVPCGTSVMINSLLDLHGLTGDERYLDDAVTAIEAISAAVDGGPSGTALTTLAVHRLTGSHPDRLGGEAPTAGRGTFDRTEPVQVRTSTDLLRIAGDDRARLDVTVQIAPGYHVNANRPGIEYLIPLEVALVGGDGVEIDVSYPAGERYDGPEGPMMVHHGTVTLPVTVRRTGPITGRPRLTITYQVCTDKACLAPQTEPLAVAIREADGR